MIKCLLKSRLTLNHPEETGESSHVQKVRSAVRKPGRITVHVARALLDSTS